MPSMQGSSSFDMGSGLLGLIQMADTAKMGGNPISDPYGLYQRQSVAGANAAGLLSSTVQSQQDEERRKQQLFQIYIRQLLQDMGIKKAIQYGSPTPVTAAPRQAIAAPYKG